MRAVDTNVVVRYLTGDDPVQSQKARAIVDGGTVFLALTVLLETEWVLRTLYGIRGTALHNALDGFVRLPRVSVEQQETIARALEWLAAGMDFADALHLASAEGCEEFVTFDKDFARLGEKISGTYIRLL